MRTLAEHDFERVARVARWPIGELLHACMAVLKQRAHDDYQHAMLVWAATPFGPKKKRPPVRPSILNE